MNERTDEGEGTRALSIDALLDRITLTPYGMPVRLMEAVLERGSGVTAALAEALERGRDDEEHDALWLIVLLGESGDPDAVAPLIRLLHRTDLDLHVASPPVVAVQGHVVEGLTEGRDHLGVEFVIRPALTRRWIDPPRVNELASRGDHTHGQVSVIEQTRDLHADHVYGAYRTFCLGW